MKSRVGWILLAAVFGATALFVPIRIAFVQSQPVPEAPPGAVTIAKFKFAPDALTVKAGTKVVFTNTDPTEHTVTADDASFDSKPLATGAPFTATVTKSVSYHCNIHPSMVGTVTVGG